MTEQQLRDKLESELLPILREKGEETHFENTTWVDLQTSRILKLMHNGWDEKLAANEYSSLKFKIEQLEDELPAP